MNHETDEDVLNSLVGHEIKQWSLTPDGMHFGLDDGRNVIFAGSFVVAVYQPEDIRVH